MPTDGCVPRWLRCTLTSMADPARVRRRDRAQSVIRAVGYDGELHYLDLDDKPYKPFIISEMVHRQVADGFEVAFEAAIDGGVLEGRFKSSDGISYRGVLREKGSPGETYRVELLATWSKDGSTLVLHGDFKNSLLLLTASPREPDERREGQGRWRLGGRPRRVSR
jgi:hypothetical protein